MGTLPSPGCLAESAGGKMFTSPGKTRVFSVLTSSVKDLHDAGQEVEFAEHLITGHWRNQNVSLCGHPSCGHLCQSAGGLCTGLALMADTVPPLALWICTVQLSRRQRPIPPAPHQNKKQKTSSKSN